MTDRELLKELERELMLLDIHIGNGRTHEANNLVKNLWAKIGEHVESHPLPEGAQ